VDVCGLHRHSKPGGVAAAVRVRVHTGKYAIETWRKAGHDRRGHMLLLITASRDATANLLYENCNLAAFRLNYDLWQDYSIRFQPDRWEIANPTGRTITSESATHCFWWKAFNFPIAADSYLIAEIKYLFRELYGTFLRRGLTVGNPPDFHNQCGKLQILHMASKYFRIPDTLCGWNLPAAVDRLDAHELVAKSLSSEQASDGKVLFTSAVPYAQLDRTFPWFLQTKVDARDDVTIFVCGESQFAFSRSRENLPGLDWRRVIADSTEEPAWRPRTLLHGEEKALHALCRELGVQWGRFDFLEDDRGLVFLEFNANGQFGFLDFHGDNGLLRAASAYLATPPTLGSADEIGKTAQSGRGGRNESH
jgi:hypothetical protein